MNQHLTKNHLKPTHPFFSYLFLVFKTTVKVWPVYAIIVSLKAITEVLQVFLYSLGTAKLVQYVFVAQTGANVTGPVIIWLVILIFIWLLDNLLTNLLHVHSTVFYEKVKTYLSKKVAKTLNSLPYAYFEDKQFQTDLKTFETIAMPKFITSTDYLPNFVKSLLVFAISVGIFVFKYPVALLIILGVILEIFMVRPYVLDYNKQRDKIAGLSRYVDYFMQQVLGLTNYRLNKVYSLYSYLGYKLNYYSTRLQATLYKLNKKLGQGRIITGSLGNIVGRFIPWAYYTYAAIMKKITPEQYVFIFSLVSRVHNKTFVFMRIGLELLSASDYYDILDMFVNGNYPVNRLNKAKIIKEISQIGGKFKLQNLESIELKNIWFKYPDSKSWVIKDFSFKIQAGKPILITGPNGIGKTTLFYIIYGLFKTQKGRIIVNNKYELSELNLEDYQKHIGYVLQENPQLYLELADNVALQKLRVIAEVKGVNNLGTSTKAKVKTTVNKVKLKQALKLATLTDLVQLVNKNASQILGKFFAEGKELSGGQWRKLAIARLFYADTPMWLLDEPFVNIDLDARKTILNNLINLATKRDKILVIVSHLPEVKKVFEEKQDQGFRVVRLGQK